MGNKHLSVLMLYVRSVIYPVIALLVLFGGVQTGLFLWAMQRGAVSVEGIVEMAFAKTVWRAALLLLFLLLFRKGGGSYTIRRLRITERAAFLWHSLACFCCYVLLWLTALILSAVLCQYFLSLTAVDGLSGQALFLAFYRSDFLHSMLPLEEVSRWIWLLTALASIALTTANAQVRLRYGAKPTPMLLNGIVVLWFFLRPLGSMASDVLLTGVHLCIAAYAVWDVWYNAEEVATDEEN